MMLSFRKADQTPVLTALEKNQDLLTALQQPINDQRLRELTEWVAEKYSCSQEEAQKALQALLRPQLSRLSQRNIFIPPTHDNPKGKVLPATPKDDEIVSEDQEAKIDAVPPVTDEEKKEVVEDAVVEDPTKNRQQQLIDTTAALKVTVNEIAQAMFQITLTQDALGEIAKKTIDQVAQECAKQTATVVKTLVSPMTP